MRRVVVRQLGYPLEVLSIRVIGALALQRATAELQILFFCGYEWWLQSAGLNVTPVNTLEECVNLYLIDVQPDGRIVCQHELHEVASISLQILRKIQLSRATLLHDGSGIVRLVLSLERREATDHLTNENAYAPDVGFVRVAHVGEHDLWRTVARRAAVSVGTVVLDVLQLLGKAKVYQLHVPLRVDQNVLWFQVAIYNATLVESFDCEHNLSKVKAGVLLAHENLLTHLLDELAAR